MYKFLNIGKYVFNKLKITFEQMIVEKSIKYNLNQ